MHVHNSEGIHMKVVVVGGVAGGMSAAARLRRLDEKAEIVVLERDAYVSFANCGLPYHIGGDIQDREALLLQTPLSLRESLGLDVRTGHEVMGIDRSAHVVNIHDRQSGADYTETYDALVLATGATPLRPPLPGIDHHRIRTLRNIPDMDAIIEILDGDVQSAVVVGGGYIGLEMVEALRHRGIDVTLVEALDQVMTVLDREMSTHLKEHLAHNGVRVLLSTKANAFSDDAGRVAVELDSERIVTDLVILAIGVRPESSLARAAGLELSDRGAVIVDQHMRTSDPDIYAVGDSIQVVDTVTGEPVVIPLAGPANRQGRIAADNISGRDSSYSSTQGTGIVKLFELTAGMTGATERTFQRLGRPYLKVHVHPSGHASYYPGTHAMHLKVLFDPTDGKLLGAQAVGVDGVDKRIDVLAVAIRAGLTIEDLEHLELPTARRRIPSTWRGSSVATCSEVTLRSGTPRSAPICRPASSYSTSAVPRSTPNGISRARSSSRTRNSATDSTRYRPVLRHTSTADRGSAPTLRSGFSCRAAGRMRRPWPAAS
jgi:NADPH-dependent 2,4-dienoyl-CoA reductase/sulfur reductase-like enzyme